VHLQDWLILSQQDWLHGHQLDTLLQSVGTVRGLCRAPPAQLRAAGLSTVAIARLKQPVKQHLRCARHWAELPGNQVITWLDEAYPPLLREISDPPAVLFLRGRSELLVYPQLAMVGSRRATPGGRENAESFAHALAGHGFVITSGLAAGVDTAAHRGALRAGGQTIAVCATGLDQVYPRGNRTLAEEIAAQGTLLSEYPPGCGPQAFRFPRRNRIISGLSAGTLVIEAGWRSGALITARLAGEQGREVFALPGSIHNPMARGCHRLIRQGAKLVEQVTDIVEELGGALGGIAQTIEQNTSLAATGKQISPADDEQNTLLNHLGWDPVSVDQLTTRSGLTAAEVSSMLMLLVLTGRVEPLVGGRYQQREEGQLK
jgi:DNA processing protein